MSSAAVVLLLLMASVQVAWFFPMLPYSVFMVANEGGSCTIVDDDVDAATTIITHKGWYGKVDSTETYKYYCCNCIPTGTRCAKYNDPKTANTAPPPICENIFGIQNGGGPGGSFGGPPGGAGGPPPPPPPPPQP